MDVLFLTNPASDASDDAGVRAAQREQMLAAFLRLARDCLTPDGRARWVAALAQQGLLIECSGLLVLLHAGYKVIYEFVMISKVFAVVCLRRSSPSRNAQKH